MSPEPHSCIAAGLHIIVEAIAVSTRWFTADNKPCAVVQVISNKGGPMGHQIQSQPCPVFELDAEMEAFRELAVFFGSPQHAGRR